VLPTRRIPPWAIAIAVPALTALQMFRRPTAPPVWDSLWAEDGKIFLSQALSANFFDTLKTSYYGYIHTGPRLIAFVASWFPVADATLVMSLLTAVVIALLAVYVFEASADWIASPLLRAVLALAVPFLPVTSREMAGTLSHLHWYLDYAAFWAVISTARSRTWLLASAAVVGLAVLSDPLCGVFLPLALVLAIRARTRAAWLLPAVLAAGLLVQFALRDQGAIPVARLDSGLIPMIYADRVTSSLLVGDRYLKDVFASQDSSVFAWASLAAVAIAVAAGLWYLRGRRAWLLAGGAALSLTFFLIAVLSRGTSELVPHDPWLLASSRYAYLPVLFLLTGLVALVDRAAPTARVRVAEVAVAVAVLAVFGANYRAPHRTSGDHRWKFRVAEAKLACAGDRRVGGVTVYTSRLNGRTAALPGFPPRNWRVPVPCSRLR
jgi:hypothetical protein